MLVCVFCARSQNVSVEYENTGIELTVYDSTRMPGGLISFDAMYYFPLQIGVSHTSILDGTNGELLVDIHSTQQGPSPFLYKPRHMKPWNSIYGQMWTLGYADPINGMQYHSTFDMELFTSHALAQAVDGHDVCVSDFGDVYTIIKETTYEADSTPVVWTNIHVKYETGEEDVLQLQNYFSELDLSLFAVNYNVGGPYGAKDPLHGNGLYWFYDENSGTEYLVMTLKTINQLIVFKNPFTVGMEVYRFGGNIGGDTNDFLTGQEYFPIQAHHPIILNAGSDYIDVSFFSNGDGYSQGGLAYGREVHLDFSTMDASLIFEFPLAGYSNAMGSYNPYNGLIASGVFFDDPPNWSISPVLFTQYDLNVGDKIMELERGVTDSMFCYQVNWADESFVDMLKLPSLEVTCNGTGTEMYATVTKDGVHDSFQFFVDGIAWNGSLINGNTIMLPEDFNGTVRVMSRYYSDVLLSFVDKYSEIVTVPEDFCSVVSGVRTSSDKQTSLYYNDQTLHVRGSSGGVVRSLVGGHVHSFTGNTTSVAHLAPGVYIFSSLDHSFSQRFVKAQ